MTQPENTSTRQVRLLQEPQPAVPEKRFWEHIGWPLGAIALIVLGLAPWVAWYQKPTRTLAVRVLDKTVPDRSFREHKGLFWILDHEKIRKPEGRPYAFEEDYIGFEPLGKQKYRLKEGDLSAPADLVYIADTYGVYHEEFYGENKGNRSPLLYGGLELEEVASIRQSLAKGGTLVAEFNTFQSPTGPAAREALCKWLGVRWSGWMGRHFDELKRGLEIPLWVVRNFEKQYGREYAFTGPGFLFCNDRDEVVILDDARYAGASPCTLHFTEQGQSHLKVRGSFPYNYWFDVSSVEPGTSVHAEFLLDFKPDGAEELRKHGIPMQFPAIFHRKDNQNDLYYFAGDFADHTRYPWIVRYRGLVPLKSLFSSNRDERFFWAAYVPMMQTILERTVKAK